LRAKTLKARASSPSSSRRCSPGTLTFWFALLALAITGYAGIYIYRNLGSSLTAIAGAMTRLRVRASLCNATCCTEALMSSLSIATSALMR
jgi:hypothetical protein